MDPQATKAKYASFEQLGEAQVRDRIATRAFNEDNRALALTWLESKERERAESAAVEARATKAEEIELQRRAASAAEDAAASARDAAASAREANAIARDANALASDANTFASRANRRAAKASKIAIAAAAIAAAAVGVSIVLPLLTGH